MKWVMTNPSLGAGNSATSAAYSEGEVVKVLCDLSSRQAIFDLEGEPRHDLNALRADQEAQREEPLRQPPEWSRPRVEPRIAIFIRADNARSLAGRLISARSFPCESTSARRRRADRARRLPRRCSRPALRTSRPPPGARTAKPWAPST